jgi:Na+-transporting methylmalonyl-CoA/oxaloacetate decarboxylase gamma subunit
MHLTEGMLVFVVAFAILGGVAWAFGKVEDRFWPAKRDAAADAGDDAPPSLPPSMTPAVSHG